MTASLLKNFSSMASLMPFLRASLRQSMMRRLALVGKDKDGWKRADEHLTTLMDQEHMITIEDTDAAIKRCEQYLQRAATDEGSPNGSLGDRTDAAADAGEDTPQGAPAGSHKTGCQRQGEYSTIRTSTDPGYIAGVCAPCVPSHMEVAAGLAGILQEYGQGDT